MFRSSGTHELYAKWTRGEARRPRLRVLEGKVFVNSNKARAKHSGSSQRHAYGRSRLTRFIFQRPGHTNLS